jgi:hypothetical protein
MLKDPDKFVSFGIHYVSLVNAISNANDPEKRQELLKQMKVLIDKIDNEIVASLKRLKT